VVLPVTLLCVSALEFLMCLSGARRSAPQERVPWAPYASGIQNVFSIQSVFFIHVISIECGPHGQVLACLIRRVLACLIARGRHSLLGRGICVLLILKQYKNWLKNDVPSVYGSRMETEINYIPEAWKYETRYAARDTLDTGPLPLRSYTQSPTHLQDSAEKTSRVGEERSVPSKTAERE
jgi:hypothetical protein